MSANKEKQNIRFKITSTRVNKKVRYDGLTADQIKIIKAQKKYEQYERELNDFWRKAPRNLNNGVDWDNMNDEQLDLFEYIKKQKEKASKMISKLEDKGIDLGSTLKIFMMLNTKSASY